MRWLFRLAVLCAMTLSPTASVAITYDISFDDPGGANAAFYTEIQSNLGAAFADWSRFFTSDASLQVEVTFDSGALRASSTSAATVPVDVQNGVTVGQVGAAYEIRTGIDPNGPAPDILVFLNPAYVADQLWFDPDPAARTAPVPFDKTDAYSVMIHELGHAFGFTGFLDTLTGNPALAGFESSYDALMAPGTTNPAFIGAGAEAVYGGPVPLTFFSAADPRSSENIYHLGNVPPGAGQDLAGDLMNGIAFVNGSRYAISLLDVAILADTGIPLAAIPQPKTLTLVTAALLAVLWRRRRAKRLI